MAKLKSTIPVYNLNVNQGDTFLMQLFIKDANNSPVDLSKSQFVFKVRETAQSTEAILEAICEVDLVDTGYVNITIPSELTSQIITDGEYYGETTELYYDIQQVSNNMKTRILQGKFIVSPGISYH